MSWVTPSTITKIKGSSEANIWRLMKVPYPRIEFQQASRAKRNQKIKYQVEFDEILDDDIVKHISTLEISESSRSNGSSERRRRICNEWEWP